MNYPAASGRGIKWKLLIAPRGGEPASRFHQPWDGRLVKPLSAEGGLKGKNRALHI